MKLDVGPSVFTVSLATFALFGCGESSPTQPGAAEDSAIPLETVALEVARHLESRGPLVTIEVDPTIVGPAPWQAAFNQSESCASGGTYSMVGEAHGTFDESTGEVDEILSYAETLQGCRFEAPSGTYAVTGEIQTDGQSQTNAGGVEGSWTRVGSLTVTISGGSEHECPYDLVASIRGEGLSILGSACGSALDTNLAG